MNESTSDQSRKTGNFEPVQVIVKSFDVIEKLARNGQMGISEIAEHTGQNKSTVYRFLRTLIGLGYVVQNNKNEKYDLTLRLFEMGGAALDRNDVLVAARDVINGIAQQTREAIHVAVLEETDIVYVGAADSAHVLTMSLRIGARTPAHCTALGRVLLADRTEQEIRAMYRDRPLEPRTSKTVTDLDELIAIIDDVRRSGYAVDNEEYEDGLICVATPVRGHTGAVIAAMAMAGPRTRLTDHRIGEAIATMDAATREVARRTGTPMGSDSSRTTTQ